MVTIVLGSQWGDEGGIYPALKAAGIEMTLMLSRGDREGKDHRYAVAAGDTVLSCSRWPQYVPSFMSFSIAIVFYWSSHLRN